MQYSECRGFSGGIVVAWQSEEVMVNVEVKDFQFLHLMISLHDGPTWMFTAVYANPKEELRKELWMKLLNISKHITGGCLIDIGAMGTKFTWRGPLLNGHSRIFERLDRALSNDEWFFHVLIFLITTLFLCCFMECKLR
ncbi:hypothetical protein A2U01_0041278 [Trifolium medium]|uniref:Endonuclease/exonuclease/phosphatase family protein n=1 Tax=Trifolium medium TaxID=97028 RepID=A0A392Q8A3_9FABA|nr:hypothetical protein [Trifolium medium]